MQINYQIFHTNNLPISLQNKVAKIVQILNHPIININNLKNQCKQGIPDEAIKIRQYCWKIFLNYLPVERSKWISTIKNHQQTYKQFIKIFLPQSKYKDYPICIDQNEGNQKELCEDFKLWQQIEKDILRTHSQLNFFLEPAKQIVIPFLTNTRKQRYRKMNHENQQKYNQFLQNKQLQRITHKYDIMTRIIFIYSKLNPKLKYVQGMNQILAPLFYLVNYQKSANDIEQASCFFMFYNLMSTNLSLHIKDLDSSQSGIQGTLDNFSRILIVLMPKLWQKLQDVNVNPFLYCFRWITVLFAQEFELFDVMKLWDSIFCHDNQMLYMNFIGIAIIYKRKQVILQSDFNKIIQKLHSLKFDIDIYQIIQKANQYYQKYCQIDFKTLSQKNKFLLAKNKKTNHYYNKFNYL